MIFPGETNTDDVKNVPSKMYIVNKEISFKIYTKDNGPEFTKRLLSKDQNDKTIFELDLNKNGIYHDLIKPYTPKYNGKAERSHR